MKPPRALVVLAGAREAVRRALEQWNAGDLARIRNSNAMIETASAALREFQEAAQTGPVPAREAGRLVAELMRDASRMTGIVDACVAFQRGRLLRMGDAAPAYGANGEPVTDPRGGHFGGIAA
jgi:hypothetical protein